LLESRAVADSNGPELFVVDNTDRDYIASIDGTLDRFFVLSEPADPASTFSVRDANGNAVEVETIVTNYSIVGFHVPQALSAGASLRARLRDLAGNAAVTKQGYPGIDLAPVAGDFEGPTDFFTSDVWSSRVGSFGCDEVDVLGPRSDRGDGPAVAPPIAGERSMHIAGSNCQVFMRLQRPPGATKLLFDARAVAAVAPAHPHLAVRLLSLEAGGSESQAQFEPSWQTDDARTTLAVWVSSVRTFSLDLPPAGDGLLFIIKPSAD
jgi:hypothetical protein